MAITIRFIGALRHASGANELALDFKRGISIKELISKITKEMPALKRSLIDQQLVYALILVNGKEISVLNGLETNLKDGDHVVFVPVVHGG